MSIFHDDKIRLTNCKEVIKIMEWIESIREAIYYIEENITKELSLEGGYIMDYKIVEKDAFKIIGSCKKFKYDSAFMEAPSFWNEHISQGKLKDICGMYGINIDEKMGGNEFEYLCRHFYL